MPRAPKPTARRSLWRWAIPFALGGVGGYAIGKTIGYVRGNVDLAWLESHASLFPSVHGGLVIAFAVLTLWPQIVLHEAGHALGGLSRGMQALAFGAGPWRWERTGDRWRWRRGGRLRGISGFAMLLPRGDRGQSRIDQTIYLLSGPMMNLATLALALAVLPLVTDSPVLAALLVGTASTAALLGFINLLPFETQGWRSDGRSLLDLFRRSAEAQQARRVRHAMALTMAGVRPRDWPLDAVPRPPADARPLPTLTDINAISVCLAHALDCDDASSAREYASRLAAGSALVPEAFRPHLAISMATFAARIERDRDLLAAWRPLCEGGLLDLTALRAWLDAELAELSGDIDAASAALERARAVQTHVPDEITGLQLRECLDALASRLDSGARTTV